MADASVMAAFVFQEPGFERIAERLEGVTVVAPQLLKFELVNVAVTKARRHPQHAAEILSRVGEVLGRRWGIVWHDVDAAGVAVLAHVTGLTAYDAAYLWLAGWLEADLLTSDRKLAATAGLETERVG